MRTFANRTAAFCFLAHAAAAAAAGPVFNVNSFSDVPDLVLDGVCNTTSNAASPTCTLRAAVMEADFYAGAEEVTVNLQAGTYVLTLVPAGADDETSGDLNLKGKVHVVGKGLDISIIDANHVDRAVDIPPGAVVRLSDLRVQGGRPPISTNGGGIRNLGTLTIERSLVRDNQTTGSSGGGGIYSSGPLTIVDSMVRVNQTADSGGGILALLNLTISGSAIYANQAASFGGGIFAEDGPVHLTNSTVSANSAAYGAGLFVTSTVGAVFNNVTIATNAAGGSSAQGGGLYISNAAVQLSNSILFNTNATTGDDAACGTGGSLTSNGFNIIYTPPASCGAVGGYSTATPGIKAIAANGGLTATHALHLGSLASEAGNPSGCTDAFGAPLLVDQRGVKRPIGAHCDLGAYELEPVGDANGDGVVNVSDVFYLINYLFAGGAAPLGRASVNGDVPIDVTDVFYLINYLFANGSLPV